MAISKNKLNCLGVLAHSGGVHGGHYYAFIRPTLPDQWFKFDDERVTKEDVERAMEEQYGGEEEEEVAKEFGIPVQFQHFWLWAEREDHYRPNRPLTLIEEALSVGQLGEVSDRACSAELRLFLEVEFGPDAQHLPPPDKTKEDILLFFKLYDPVKEELRYVGRLFVKALGKPTDILTKLNEMAGFPPNEEIELYEEMKLEPRVRRVLINKKSTFQYSELEDGDIICYQKSPSLWRDNQYRYPDVCSFLEYVHNRQGLIGC